MWEKMEVSRHLPNKYEIAIVILLFFLLTTPFFIQAKAVQTVTQKNTPASTSVSPHTQPFVQQTTENKDVLPANVSGNSVVHQTVTNTLKVSQPSGSSTNQPLSQIFRHNAIKNQQYTSSNYLLKVFILLGFVLGLFYVLAKLIVPKFTGATNLKPSSKQSETTTPSLFKSLFQGSVPKETPETQPFVLHRTRLSQTKEIHVIEVGGKCLVVGSTPSQMTLLTEFTMPQEKSDLQNRPQASDKTNDVYKKYLSPGSEPQTPADTMVAADEEIVLLSDYEDQFEHS